VKTVSFKLFISTLINSMQQLGISSSHKTKYFGNVSAICR